jgi:hypothetical protein
MRGADRAKRDGDRPHLDTLPVLVPVPGLDGHVVAPGEHDGRGRVHGHAADVVRVGLERVHLLERVVVEDAELEVVRARDEPLLARDEARAPDGDLGDLERLEDRAGVDVVDLDGSVVQAREQPRLGRVKVDVLDAVRPGE